jgi:hypothetical protein
VAAVVLTLVVAATLAGCGSGDDDGSSGAGTPTIDDRVKVQAPAGAPSVVGTISKVAVADTGDTQECDSQPPDSVVSNDGNSSSDSCANSGGAGPTSFVLQDGKDPKGGALAANVRVPSDAKILRKTGDSYEQVGVDQLTDGATVQVWFEGPVAESYPVQATAGTIVIE